MRTITPQPGYTVEQVEAALESPSFVFADCFTIIPKLGPRMYYTNYQLSVPVVPIGEVVGRLFLGNVLQIKGLRVKCSVSVEVDEQQLQINYPAGALYQNDIIWPKAFLQGRMDGAKIRRDRFIAAGPDKPWLGGFQMFSGLMSTLVDVGRQSANLNVKSDLILLNMQMPRDLWEANCKNTWGDPHCGVDQDDWAVIGTVGSGSTRSFLAWSGASNEFDLGKIHISNGDITTRVRTISRADGTGLYLSYPLDFDPQDGFTFTAYPGCNRTKERCPHFHGDSWDERFKGFPFIPVAETALGG